MVADLAGHRADIGELPEIQTAPPDKGLDVFQEIFAKRPVTRRHARADKGRLLPRQCARFIIADRRLDRDGNGRHFWRGPQPHIDTKDIAVASTLAQQFDHAPPYAHCAIGHILALAVRQRFGVIKKDRVDVGAIVQFLPAMFAKPDDGKAAHWCSGTRSAKAASMAMSRRASAKSDKHARHSGQIPCAGQVGDRSDKGHALPLFAQSCADVVFNLDGQGAVSAASKSPFSIRRDKSGLALDQLRKKRAVSLQLCPRRTMIEALIFSNNPA